MDFGLLLMIVGLVVIVCSFFFKDRSKQLAQDVEELSMNLYEETNRLTKRVKTLEEEIMVGASLPSTKKKDPLAQMTLAAQPNAKPVNPIIVNQVLALQKQGMSVADISARSNLSEADVVAVIAQNGGLSS